MGFPGGATGKKPACRCRRYKRPGFDPWEDPLEEGMATPLQYSCRENPHGQRSLVGYSP